MNTLRILATLAWVSSSLACSASTSKGSSSASATSTPIETASATPDSAVNLQIALTKIDAGELDETEVRSAFVKVQNALNDCYVKVLETTADAKGRMFLSLLYVEGERKSAASSYSGPGAAEVMRCGSEAANALSLVVDSKIARVSVTLHVALGEQ